MFYHFNAWSITLPDAVRNALSTGTVSRWAEEANRFLVMGDQLAAECGGIAGIETILKSARKASQEAAQDNRTIGLLGLLKVLKEPEIQKGIKFLLHFVKNLDQ